MAFSDIEDYSLRSITVLRSNMHSQIIVGTVTLPKAVLSKVKLFAVHVFHFNLRFVDSFAHFVRHLHLQCVTIEL